MSDVVFALLWIVPLSGVALIGLYTAIDEAQRYDYTSKEADE